VTPEQGGQGGTEYFVVVGMFAVVAFVVIAWFAWLEQRREREYLMTIRAFLERGQAVPPELIRGPGTTRGERIRRGLLAVAIGGALTVIFGVNPGVEGAWALGLLPIAVGLARIAGAFVDDDR